MSSAKETTTTLNEDGPTRRKWGTRLSSVMRDKLAAAREELETEPRRKRARH